MKKILSGLVLLVFFAACAPARTDTPVPDGTVTPSPPTATATPVPPTGIPVMPLAIAPERIYGQSVTIWHAWSGAEQTLFSALVEEFNRTNPWRLQVSARGLGDFGLLYEAVNDALRTGSETPDLVSALPAQLQVWDAQGVLVDLTRYVYDPDYGLTPSEISDFPSVFWEQDLAGERRLGVPAQRASTLLYYNQTWAQELGFESAPATAEQFREQSCAAHVAMAADIDVTNDGQGGWIVDEDSRALYAWLTAFGGGPVRDGQYQFLNYENQEALQFLKGLYDERCAWLLDPTVPAPYEAFAARKALFVTGSLAGLPDQMRAMNAAGNADRWTVIAFPGALTRAAPVYGTSYGVLGGTDESQLAAWLFARWLLSGEGQARWVKSTGLFPLRVSALPMLSDYELSHPQWAAAVDLIPLGLGEPRDAAWRQVEPLLGDAVNYMFRYNLPAGQASALLAQIDSTVRELTTLP